VNINTEKNLWCDAMLSARQLPTFHKNLLYSSRRWRHRVSPNHLLDYMVSQPRSVLRIAHPRTETIITYDNKTNKKKHVCVICPVENAWTLNQDWRHLREIHKQQNSPFIVILITYPVSTSCLSCPACTCHWFSRQNATDAHQSQLGKTAVCRLTF